MNLIYMYVYIYKTQMHIYIYAYFILSRLRYHCRKGGERVQGSMLWLTRKKHLLATTRKLHILIFGISDSILKSCARLRYAKCYLDSGVGHIIRPLAMVKLSVIVDSRERLVFYRRVDNTGMLWQKTICSVICEAVQWFLKFYCF